ncbi:MAG: DUF427 domain-containing protein [Candidatus Dormibacteria bacterium]
MEGIGRSPKGGHRESVWDYPRPPRVELSSRHVEVFMPGRRVASTRRAHRVLETSHPPVYYIPLEDIAAAMLTPSARNTYCEYKGTASYFHLEVDGLVVRDAAWYYPSPSHGYEEIAGEVAFYPGRVDHCSIDGELVEAQPGDFYGGWVTGDVEGPFKGAPGTAGW